MGTVFYFDPPYLGTSGYRRLRWKRPDWERLVRMISKLKGTWLLTEFDGDHARKLAHGKTAFVRTMAITSRGNTGSELLARPSPLT